MRKKWIKLFPLLIGAVIAYCLLWYVIPQNISCCYFTVFFYFTEIRYRKE